MIRAIAFDWGGVFTRNTFDSSAVRNLAALYGTGEEIIASCYYPLMAEFEVGAFDFASFYHRFTEASGLTRDAGAFRETFLGSVLERREMFAVLAGIPNATSSACSRTTCRSCAIGYETIHAWAGSPPHGSCSPTRSG